MTVRGGEAGSGISVLSVPSDDDDDGFPGYWPNK